MALHSRISRAFTAVWPEAVLGHRLKTDIPSSRIARKYYEIKDFGTFGFRDDRLWGYHQPGMFMDISVL